MRIKLTGSLVFALFVSVIVVTSLVTSREWSFATRLFPWAMGIPALILCAIQLFLEVRRARGAAAEVENSGVMDLMVDRDVPLAQVVRRGGNIFAWIFGLFASIMLIGFVITAPLFIWLYLNFQAREKWWVSLLWTVIIVVFLLGLFHFILRVPWPHGIFDMPQEKVLEWIG
jgi:hypothetical protein